MKIHDTSVALGAGTPAVSLGSRAVQPPSPTSARIGSDGYMSNPLTDPFYEDFFRSYERFYLKTRSADRQAEKTSFAVHNTGLGLHQINNRIQPGTDWHLTLTSRFPS
jgi:hypothetical protein